jgi:peroxiredoxin
MTTAEQSIAEQVALLQEGIASRLPAEVIAQFASEQARLDDAGVPEAAAVAGSPMPDGDLLDAGGETVSLAKTIDGRPAVIVFYRGAWCPYCNLTLRTYQRQLIPALADRGVAFLALSPQSPDGSLSMQQSNELTFTVLSDPGNQVAGKLGILTAPSAEVRRARADLGLDVAAGNADGTDTMPMPTAVVVDRSGTIRWIDVHPNYTTRSEPAQILQAVESMIR